MTNYKILITGSGTLVGNSISQYFIKKNKQIIASYRSSYPLNLISKNCKIIKLDLQKKINLKPVNCLIHAAAAVPHKTKSKNDYQKTNIDGLKKLLFQINKNNSLKKIIFISTMSVYGKINTQKVDEKYIPFKQDDYGISKSRMEIIIKKFCKKNSIKCIILRLSGVIGHKSESNFISNIMLKLKNNEKIVYSNPNKYFNNIIYSNDLAKIVYEAYKSNDDFQIYNVASKYPIKLKNVINKIAKSLKSTSKIIIVKETKNFTINISKILRDGYTVPFTKKTLSNFIEKNNKIKLI